MGSSQSAPKAPSPNEPSESTVSAQLPPQEDTPQWMTEPPKMPKVETFEEKLFRKFSQQPLIPLGCLATTYFLVSGIRSSFYIRDPVRSQKMMRGRVAAQFATIMIFIGYMGTQNFDLRIAPMYQDAKKMERMLQQEAAAAAATASEQSSPKK